VNQGRARGTDGARDLEIQKRTAAYRMCVSALFTDLCIISKCSPHTSMVVFLGVPSLYSCRSSNKVLPGNWDENAMNKCYAVMITETLLVPVSRSRIQKWQG
jgi:hypothetical protein